MAEVEMCFSWECEDPKGMEYLQPQYDSKIDEDEATADKKYQNERTKRKAKHADKAMNSDLDRHKKSSHDQRLGNECTVKH